MPAFDSVRCRSTAAWTKRRTLCHRFQHGSLSVEIYAPRGTDPQKPHTRDEVYFVAAGTGDYVCGDTRQSFGLTDLLFAAAGVVHRFENFTDDLTVWVLFYGPEGGEDDG